MATSRAIRPSLRLIKVVHSAGNPSFLTSIKPVNIIRPLTSTTTLYSGDKRSTKGFVDSDSDDHEGSFSRTDSRVSFNYPEEHEIPRSTPVQGRGGLHFKPTLASFSLEGRVSVITGGARGLGLVMSQALVISGANVAIVDLNSKLQILNFTILLTIFRGRRRKTGRFAGEAFQR